MSDKDKIAGIEDPVERRKALYDKWQNYIDTLDEELKKDVDPFESRALQKMMVISNYFHSDETRRTANLLNDLLQNKHIKDLTKAQKPGWKEIAPVVTQLVSAIGAAVLGIVPVAGAFGNSATSIMTTLSQGANSLGVGGSQAVAGLAGSAKQGAQTIASFELEDSKRQKEDAEQSRRQREQATQRHLEDMARAEEKRHQIASNTNN